MGPAVLEKTEAERTQYSILSLYIYIYMGIINRYHDARKEERI